MNDLQERAKENSNLLLPGQAAGIEIVDEQQVAKKNFFAQPIGSFEKCFYVASFMLLVAIRVPSILLKGRFWAEEGNVFFSNAWHMHWYQALPISYGGYLNITANLAGVLAKHLAPLENACYVTSIFGLIVQTFPVVILCLSRDGWLQNRKTLMAAMLIIATLPLSQEVWLSSIGSQCHLNLCVALILALSTERGATKIFHYLLLILGPLSGPGSAFLVPLYLVRAWAEKSKQRLFQGLVLGGAASIQFLFFWHPQERVLGIDPALLLDVFFVKHLVAPFLGMDESLTLCEPWRQIYLNGQIPSVAGIWAAVIVLAVFAVTAWRSIRPEPKWFFIAGLLMAALSNFGCLGDRSALLTLGANERYAFAPQILFELALLCLAYTSAGWTRTICRSLVIWLLVIATHEYFCTPGFYADGPSWHSEVKHWRHDRNYQPQIWPLDCWRVNLNK